MSKSELIWTSNAKYIPMDTNIDIPCARFESVHLKVIAHPLPLHRFW